MILKKLASVVAIMVAAVIVAFSFTAQSGASSVKEKEVTFNDVAPIFYKSCMECHRPNDIAPMPLVSYKDSRAWARSIKEKVLLREMPPWSPDPNYGEFTNDARLSQKEIDTIVAWVDGGAKEGDPGKLPPPPDFVTGGWQIGKPDVVLSMAEEYTVEPSAPDNYINFEIPADFKEDKWVKAVEIHPGNKRVVHHVIAFIRTPEMEAKRKSSERQRRGEGKNEVFYRDGTLKRVKMDAPVMDDGCSEKSSRAGQGAEDGADEGILLAGFAPGKGVDVFPQGMAKKIPKGSKIIFQMHYSSFRGDLDKAEKDRTSIGLIFAKEPPEKAIVTYAVANILFKIPPGVANHEVTACQTFRRDVELIGYMPHMHLRGKDMKYEVVYPDGRRETLLWVPKFSFNWQTFYALKNPVRIPKGTRMIVTAHFDNSAKNKYNPDPTTDVRWGDPTYDEMMIGWMDFVIDNPGQPDVARASGK